MATQSRERSRLRKGRTYSPEPDFRPTDRKHHHRKHDAPYDFEGYQHSRSSFESSLSVPPPYYEPYRPMEAPYWYDPVYASQQRLPYSHSGYQDEMQPWASAYEMPSQRMAYEQAPYPQDDSSATRRMDREAAFCDNIASRLHDIFAEMEGTRRADDEVAEMVRGLSIEDDSRRLDVPNSDKTRPGLPRERLKSGLINFRKAWMYANSRLPPHLPPLTVYMPTWRLLCMAAKASEEVYTRPDAGGREHYVDADWKNGTKAMVMKSTPMDDKNIIVIAVRGSKKNVVDWSVNFRPAPKAPVGFLDDDGNACHAGFLAVARSMIAPVAARLRQLLQQDPSRASSSLLFTGHSAGGAVASLLFSHMLATRVESELNVLTGCFKRVHCITFGAPPVSFLPLQKSSEKRHAKSVFMSFANEGDPIIRASNKAYFISWAKLLAAPTVSADSVDKKASRQRLKLDRLQTFTPPQWPIPPAALSNAGRVVLLREKPGSKQPVIEAVCTSDEQLRRVMFGDLAMHDMTLYRQRIESLAIAAITGDCAG